MGRRSGSFNALSSSNGSLLASSCGSTENVRFFQHLLGSRLLTVSDFGSWIREKCHLVRYFSLVSHQNLFCPVPPLFKTSWLFARLDQPSWPTSTSTSGISTSKPVTTFFFLSYPSSPHAPVLSVTFSTTSMRHTRRGLDSRATTL